MTPVVLAYAVGLLLVVASPGPLPGPVVGIAALVALPLAVSRAVLPAAIGGLVIGIASASLAGQVGLAAQVPHACTVEPLSLTGRVAELPRQQGHLVQLTVDAAVLPCNWQGRLRLTIDPVTQPVPQAGERIAVIASLRQVRGSVNPGGFDAVIHALGTGIAGSGHIRQITAITPGWQPPWMRWRQQVADRIQALPIASRARALLLALAIGEHQHLADADWAVLAATGTNHLLIVSGLHIGFACLAVGFLARGLGLSLGVTGIAALAAGVTYAVLAGFGLPAQRALVMAAAAIILPLWQRRFSALFAYCLALLIVLLLDPLAMLGRGFWLSFGAVGVLLWRFAPEVVSGGGLVAWFKGSLRAQWVIFVFMTPLMLWFIGSASLVALLVNLVAIPWVTLTVPPLLLATLLTPVSGAAADGLFELCGASLGGAWQLLEFAARPALLLRAGEVPILVFLLGVIGAGLLVMPMGVRRLMPGLLCLLPLLGWQTGLPAGYWRVSFIDVGQGSAILVQSQAGAVLYDAGPLSFAGFDAGAHIVLPYLQYRGVDWLSALVVSHGDADHAGGVPAVRQRYPLARYVEAADCGGEPPWQLGELRFRLLLAPVAGTTPGSNDRSCLMQVTDGETTVLLAGDIEEEAERALLAAQLLPADLTVLAVPHHGSRTSSTVGFLNRTRPEIAVISAGYRNRFGHPHPVVVARYRRRGALVLDTARSGAVEILVTPAGLRIHEARRDTPRWWRMPGAGRGAPMSRHSLSE